MAHYLKHFHTVMKHKWLVMVHSFKCGIPLRGILHDLSKFSPNEFISSAKYYNGHYSPIVNERKNDGLYSSVFTHHTNHNKHHFEYWISEYKGDFVLKAMPYKYALEYVCDMIAASKTYLGKEYKKDEPLKFFLSRYDHYLMHSATKEFVNTLLTRYAEKGFKSIKKKETKKIYEYISKKFPNNEYIRCYSLNNKFIKEEINQEFIKKQNER